MIQLRDANIYGVNNENSWENTTKLGNFLIKESIPSTTINTKLGKQNEVLSIL